jgi:hypothetical protein
LPHTVPTRGHVTTSWTDVRGRMLNSSHHPPPKTTAGRRRRGWDQISEDGTGCGGIETGPTTRCPRMNQTSRTEAENHRPSPVSGWRAIVSSAICDRPFSHTCSAVSSAHCVGPSRYAVPFGRDSAITSHLQSRRSPDLQRERTRTSRDDAIHRTRTAPHQLYRAAGDSRPCCRPKTHRPGCACQTSIADYHNQ